MEAFFKILSAIYENLDGIMILLTFVGTVIGSAYAIIERYKQKGLQAAIEQMVQEKAELEEALNKVWELKKQTEAKYTSVVTGIELAPSEAGKLVKEQVEKLSTKLGVADDLHKDTRNIPLLSEVYRRNKTVRTVADIVKHIKFLF